MSVGSKQLALRIQLNYAPAEIGQVRASLSLDERPLDLAPLEAPVSQQGWEHPLDGNLRGILGVHVDGEDAPFLVRAEGDAAIQLSGQEAVSLGISLRRKEVCANGWCWLSPLPASTTINRLWAFAANNVLALGDRGLFMQWDGRAWRIRADNPLGTHATADIWATSSDDIWLFDSYSAAASRWNGVSWADAPAPSFPIRKVWGFADGSLWAVGRAGNIARFDGKTWRSVASGISDDLWALWGSASTDLWVVGDRGTILRWNGSTFTTETQGIYPELFAVWGSGSGGDVWAVGRMGTIVHRVAGSWSASTSSTSEWLYGIDGRSSSDLWAYGDNGTVLHYDGTRWSRPLTKTASVSLRTSSVGSDGQLWLAGTGGTLIHGSVASGLTTVTGGLPHFRDIWGTSDHDLWIVGVEGAIYHFDGIRWKPVPSGYTHDLNALWGSGPNDIWAVGWGGPKLHWDGSRWSAPSSTADYLFAAWGSGADDIWAVGDASGIAQHWDGTAWRSVDTGLRTYLYGLWGSDSRNIWTTGYGGACARWDGLKWNLETLPVTGGEIYSGIFGTGPHDVWIATPLYDMLHWDGTSWSRFDNGGVSGFRALWGSSATDIWAVGSYGVTSHYAPLPPTTLPSWTVTYNGTASYRGGALHRVFGLDRKHIWAVGDDGAVLKIQPSP